MLVDAATDETPKPVPSPAQESGRRGGLKGGKARADALTAGQRAEIASNAAKARWKANEPVILTFRQIVRPETRR